MPYAPRTGTSGPLRPVTSGKTASPGSRTLSRSTRRSPRRAARACGGSRVRRTRCVRGEDEAADAAPARLVGGVGPDDRDVGDRAVGDPQLAAGQGSSRRRHGGRGWSSRPGSEPVRLGQPSSRRLCPQPSTAATAACALAAEHVDRAHRERPLHRDEEGCPSRPPELDTGQSGSPPQTCLAPIAVQVHAEQPGLAELPRELAGGHLAVFVPLGDVLATLRSVATGAPSPARPSPRRRAWRRGR